MRDALEFACIDVNVNVRVPVYVYVYVSYVCLRVFVFEFETSNFLFDGRRCMHLIVLRFLFAVVFSFSFWLLI